MKYGLMLFVSVFVFGGPVFAQELPTLENCTTLLWEAPPDTDLAGYRVFVQKDGVALEPVVVDSATATSFPCADLPIVEGATYGVTMAAFDTSGNESASSPPIAFAWPDVTSPAVPMNGCITHTAAGIEVKTCWTLLP